jgi:hypothetical protein
MTDVHTNGRVTHPDRETLAAAERTQIRLASYLPDDMDEGPRVANGDDMEAEWRRFVELALQALAALMFGLLAVLVVVAVGSGVLGW